MSSRGSKHIFGAVVDVETTGLSPVQDEIIELCIVLFRCDYSDGQPYVIEDEYVGLREPSCGLRPAAAKVNGITRADVQGKELDYKRVSEIIARADFLIAHNASFDRNFLTRLFPNVSGKQWYCSMSGIDWRGKGYPNRKLQDLLYFHGIIPARTHRASDDVRATLELLSYRQSCGMTYLSELLAGRRLRAQSS
jgi:DNA polymerase III, epsilon subunit and related 3''-5'' exonucleases